MVEDDTFSGRFFNRLLLFIVNSRNTIQAVATCSVRLFSGSTKRILSSFTLASILTVPQIVEILHYYHTCSIFLRLSSAALEIA